MEKRLGVTILEWIFLIVCFIILLVYLSIRLNTPNPEKYTKENNVEFVDLNNVYETADNGDLIFLAGNTKGEKNCRWIDNCIFNHVGFLFREINPKTKKDVLYIWDSDLGQNSKEGVRLMPLKDKLKVYKGFRIGAIKRLIGKRPETKDIITNIIPKYISKGFDTKIITWWVSNIDFLYKKLKDENKVFCSELVAGTLQDLDILKKEKIPAWYSPGSFLKNTDMKIGYSYTQPEYFKF